MRMKKIKFIKVKSELGARHLGASLGPDAIEIAALNAKAPIFRDYETEEITAQNTNIILNNKPVYAEAHYIDELIDLYTRLASSVSNTIKLNTFPIVLSGDHSTAGGTIAGLKIANPQQRIGIVWVDAHTDIHSPYTSESGNMHGMPVNTAIADDNIECTLSNRVVSDEVKNKWHTLKNIGGISPKILPEDIVYVAVRSTEKEEDALTERLKIKKIPTEELRRNGAGETATLILEYLNNCDAIYISFDIDSLEDYLVKGTGTPEKNGLTEQEAIALVNKLLDSGMVNCLEISEVNPTLDDGNKTSQIAFNIINEGIKHIQ